MKVEGFNSYAPPSVQSGASRQLEQKVKKSVGEHLRSIDAPEPFISGSEESEPVTKPDTEKTRGVIRLLQEGHFKGVADVRLRINFFEELSSLENKEVRAVAQETFTGIIETVESEFSKLLTSYALTGDQSKRLTELKEAFLQGITQLKDDFVSSETLSKDSLMTGLTTAFEEFIASLATVLTPPEISIQTEAIASHDVPQETAVDALAGEDIGVVAEPVSDEPLQDISLPPLEGLTGAFSTTLEEFGSALEGVALLPEPSQPKGNGEAYAKFLTIYNQMRGLTPPLQEPETAPLISAVV